MQWLTASACAMLDAGLRENIGPTGGSSAQILRRKGPVAKTFVLGDRGATKCDNVNNAQRAAAANHNDDTTIPFPSSPARHATGCRPMAYATALVHMDKEK